VRLRLAVLGTVLATGTVLLLSALVVALAAAAAPREQDETLDTLARQAAASYRPGGGDPAVTTDAQDSTDPFVLVVDGTGDTVFAGGVVGDRVPTVPEDLVQRARRDGTARCTSVTGGVHLRMSARAVDGGGGGGSGAVVIAAQPTGVLADQRSGLVAVVVIAALLTAVAGAVATRVVSGRALRPLRDLAATAGDIARTGDVGRRLPTPGGRDEVAALALEFNAMMDRLESSQAGLAEALDQQRRFVADASHELRTPLATIRSNAGFLVERPDAAPADRAEALRDLQQEADRMASLVDGLLVLARTDAAPARDRQPVDLAEVAREVCRLTGARWVPADGPGWVPGGTVVRGDAAMLHRMLRCLVDNGLVHGGGEVGVRVGRVSATWVLATVWDGGPGFPEEDLPYVFDRFHRSRESRSRPGSGLGLAIARSVARRHGGEVRAANGPQRGAVLTVRLPAAG
jgi:signal transduction histidine kinase